MVGSHWEPREGPGYPSGLWDLLCPFFELSSAPLNRQWFTGPVNTGTQTTGHGFSLYPLSFSGAMVRLQRRLSRWPWVPQVARAGGFSVGGPLLPRPPLLRRTQPLQDPVPFLELA